MRRNPADEINLNFLFNEHGGQKKGRSEESGKNFIDFSVSLNPYPPPMNFSFDPALYSDYPDNNYKRLKTKIAETHGCNPNEISVGNGSIEILRAFCTYIFRDGSSFFTFDPTFGEYETSAILAGGKKTTDIRGARVIFLCNPNNPTGELKLKEKILELLAFCNKEKIILFLDEAFIDLSDPFQSLITEKNKDLFVLRSLTKSFSVPGLRIGYSRADPELTRFVECFRSPWSVNRYAEEWTISALTQYDKLEESRQKIWVERDWLVKRLREFGFDVRDTDTNFILFNAQDKLSLISNLEREGILVRDCGSFGLVDAIRIGIRTHDENKKLISAIERCLQ